MTTVLDDRSDMPPTAATTDPAAQARILEQLAEIGPRIADAQAALDALWAQRLALYRAGVEAGASKAAMGRASGCTAEAVIHTLNRPARRTR